MSYEENRITGGRSPENTNAQGSSGQMLTKNAQMTFPIYSFRQQNGLNLGETTSEIINVYIEWRQRPYLVHL